MARALLYRWAGRRSGSPNLMVSSMKRLSQLVKRRPLTFAALLGLPTAALAATWGGVGPFATVNGRVGVNVSQPPHELSVKNLGAGNAADVQLVNDSTGASAGDGLMLREEGLTGELMNLEAGPLVLGADGYEVLRLTEAGDVGIGTTSPDATLDIEDPDGPLIEIADGSGARLQIAQVMVDGHYSPSSGVGEFVFRAMDGGSATDPGMIFSLPTSGEVNTRSIRFADDDAVIMTVQNGGADGKVGIGTDQPDERLHVEGDLKINGAIVSDGAICIGSGC